jgi:hypothetical protein
VTDRIDIRGTLRDLRGVFIGFAAIAGVVVALAVGHILLQAKADADAERSVWNAALLQGRDASKAVEMYRRSVKQTAN